MTWFFEIAYSRVLGMGGEGCVYFARSVTSGRAYAAKFPNALIPSVARTCLRRELRRVLRVRGEFVARPVAWNLGLRPFVVYEFAELGSLRQEMASMFSVGKTYHPRFALKRAHQMLLGVRDAHRAGIVHRDVKPDNYLVYSHDRIKLSDFGAGRTLDRVPNRLTNGFVGTPRYAAPEQLWGLPVDGRADLYAVGIVLYEMLTGFTPDRERGSPLPSQFFRNVTPNLDALCRRLLAWNPWDRPRTVDQALAEVSAVWYEHNGLRRRYNLLGLPSPY